MKNSTKRFLNALVLKAQAQAQAQSKLATAVAGD